MIAELKIEKGNYAYVVKSNNVVVIESNLYSTRQSAIRGFKRFNRSINLGKIVACIEEDCFYIEVLDTNNRVLVESVDLGNKFKVRRLRNRIRKSIITLKDVKSNKMYFYINKIGEIELSKPITVEIEKNDDIVASIDFLNLFAYGDSIDEVINELKEDLEDLYNDLFSNEYQLAKPAVNMKNNLANFLI